MNILLPAGNAERLRINVSNGAQLEKKKLKKKKSHHGLGGGEMARWSPPFLPNAFCLSA